MKKVNVKMTVTEEYTSTPVVVLEIPDDMQRDELLSLGVGFYFDILSESMIRLESEKTDMDVMDQVEVGAATADDQPVARLVRSESGKIEWQWSDGMSDKALDSKIRRSACKQHLVARKSRQDGLWYFSDETNLLRSSELGMDSEEALNWLEECQ